MIIKCKLFDSYLQDTYTYTTDAMDMLLDHINLASYPDPLKKLEKRAWYPLFAHVLSV